MEPTRCPSAVSPHRRHMAAGLAVLAMSAGCALPPNTGLQRWAHTASVVVGQVAPGPAAAPAAGAGSNPGDGIGDAMRAALAVYLFALAVVAEERILTFREDAYAAILARPAAGDAAASEAVSRLGLALRAARDANPDPVAQAHSAGSPTVIEDLRLRPLLLAAEAPVQRLIAMLSARAGEDTASRAVLARIGEGHALLASRARSPVRLGQRETEREIRASEDALLRAARDLSGTPNLAAAAVAATVQP